MERGFTLIELLVVTTIVATLAAILFPVFAQTKEASRRSVCVAKEKQIGLAMVMYAGDYDDVFPAVMNGYETLSDGVNHEVSWIAVIQPYAERARNIDDRGKSIFDLDAEHGKLDLMICPSQTPDPRASVNYLGQPRASSGGVGVSYALLPYAYRARSQSEFRSLAETILVAEQYLNFTSTYYYPVDYDNDPGEAVYGANEAATNDCRFDRGEPCTFLAGTYPARPQAMPGVASPWISNLPFWHGPESNFVFADGHVKCQSRPATYRPDGSFSAWTMSNRWCRIGQSCAD